MEFCGYMSGFLTIEILEIGQFYPFPHTQNVCCAAHTIEHHPHIAGIES